MSKENIRRRKSAKKIIVHRIFWWGLLVAAGVLAYMFGYVGGQWWALKLLM